MLAHFSRWELCLIERIVVLANNHKCVLRHSFAFDSALSDPRCASQRQTMESDLSALVNWLEAVTHKVGFTRNDSTHSACLFGEILDIFDFFRRDWLLPRSRRVSATA
jgi:hypothetical protein